MSEMERTAGRYDLIADFYHGVIGNKITDPATATLLHLIGDVRGLRVLDLACGQGRVARELARRGALVVGIDISRALLDKARAAESEGPLGVTYLSVDTTS